VDHWSNSVDSRGSNCVCVCVCKYDIVIFRAQAESVCYWTIFAHFTS